MDKIIVFFKLAIKNNLVKMSVVSVISYKEVFLSNYIVALSISLSQARSSKHKIALKSKINLKILSNIHSAIAKYASIIIKYSRNMQLIRLF